MTREQVVQQALALTPQDRCYVAARIADSLLDEPPAPATAAWLQELDRRAEQIERGEVQTLSLEEAMSQAYRELEAHRAAQGRQ